MTLSAQAAERMRPRVKPPPPGEPRFRPGLPCMCGAGRGVFAWRRVVVGAPLDRAPCPRDELHDLASPGDAASAWRIRLPAGPSCTCGAERGAVFAWRVAAVGTPLDARRRLATNCATSRARAALLSPGGSRCGLAAAHVRSRAEPVRLTARRGRPPARPRAVVSRRVARPPAPGDAASAWRITRPARAAAHVRGRVGPVRLARPRGRRPVRPRAVASRRTARPREPGRRCFRLADHACGLGSRARPWPSAACSPGGASWSAPHSTALRRFATSCATSRALATLLPPGEPRIRPGLSHTCGAGRGLFAWRRVLLSAQLDRSTTCRTSRPCRTCAVRRRASKVVLCSGRQGSRCARPLRGFGLDCPSAQDDDPSAATANGWRL
jgi:hypothetical protein